MKLALCCNKAVLMTQQLIQRAEWGVYQSYSDWLPQIQAYSQAFKTQFTQAPMNPTSTLGFLSQIYLTQSLFSTDNYYGTQIQKLYKDEANWIYSSLINEISYQVKSAYYKVVLDKQQIETTKERVDLLSRLHEEMRGRYKIGETIIYNVNQSKVALINATASYYQAIKDYKSDLDSLAQIIGFDPACVTLVVNSLKTEFSEICLIASKLKKAEERMSEDTVPVAIEKNSFFSETEIVYFESLSNKQRPELFRAYTIYKIAVQEVNKRKGTYLPELDLIVNYGGDPTPWVFNPSPHFGDQSMTWGAGLQLNWMLFDSFGREFGIRKAQAEARAQNLNYQNIQQKVHQEVRSQIWGIEEGLAQYAYSVSNVSLAEEMVEQARDQLAVGYITIFDFEIAVDELAEARMNRDRAVYNLIVSYYGLMQASGSLINGR